MLEKDLTWIVVRQTSHENVQERIMSISILYLFAIVLFISDGGETLLTDVRTCQGRTKKIPHKMIQLIFPNEPKLGPPNGIKVTEQVSPSALICK